MSADLEEFKLATRRAERLGLELGSCHVGVEGRPDRIWQTPYEAEIEHSKAISLRRIADALDRMGAQRELAAVAQMEREL